MEKVQRKEKKDTVKWDGKIVAILFYNKESVVYYTLSSVWEGGEMVIKCHAERDRTWHKLGCLSTVFPLFTLMLQEECFLFPFIFELGAPVSTVLPHFPRRLLTTAGLESSPSDKIKHVKLPDSVSQLLLFSICGQMFCHCVLYGYLLVDFIWQISSMSAAQYFF